MTLQSLMTTCLVASATTLISFAPWVKAADEVGQAQLSSARSITKDSDWSLRLPKEDKVIYKGVVSLDDTRGNSTHIMYPAANAVGFLAEVFTHGAIVESLKKSQKDRRQEEADKVLLPYETVLSNYKNKDLMLRGLQVASKGGRKKLVDFSEKPGADWFIESDPVFLFTQDQSAIILENSISIYAPNAPLTAAYQNTVKVVSETKAEKDLADFWTVNQGERLKEESASLFALSLDIAMSEMADGSSKDSNPQKTFRYLEGRSEKIERGQLVSEQRNRIIIKNLRGELISAPTRRNASSAPATDPCADCTAVRDK